MNIINQVSNFEKANKNSMRFYDKPLLISTRKHKKYMILNDNNKYVHFGDNRYKDYLKTGDKVRRNLYLKRAMNLNSDFNDMYNPNVLSIRLLWDGKI
jgi:hypothetical protein